jgi:hypothetical protein
MENGELRKTDFDNFEFYIVNSELAKRHGGSWCLTIPLTIHDFRFTASPGPSHPAQYFPAIWKLLNIERYLFKTGLDTIYVYNMCIVI